MTTQREDITTGRTTPPTPAEVEAHHALGGGWRWFCDDSDGGQRGVVDPFLTAAHQRGVVERTQMYTQGDAQWWAIDARENDCAWPTVTP